VDPRRIIASLFGAGLLVGAATGCSHGGSTNAFCEALGKAPALDTVVEGFADADHDELVQRLADARRAYQRLADTAPDSIDGPTDQLVALVDAVLDGVADHPDDPEAAADQIRSTVAERPDSTEAAAQVATWAKEHCDVDLNPVVVEAPTSTAPAATTTTD